MGGFHYKFEFAFLCFGFRYSIFGFSTFRSQELPLVAVFLHIGAGKPPAVPGRAPPGLPVDAPPEATLPNCFQKRSGSTVAGKTLLKTSGGALARHSGKLFSTMGFRALAAEAARPGSASANSRRDATRLPLSVALHGKEIPDLHLVNRKRGEKIDEALHPAQILRRQDRVRDDPDILPCKVFDAFHGLPEGAVHPGGRVMILSRAPGR